MSTHLEIPDALFDRIKKNAIPFVDLTPVSVLERWANYFDKAPADATPSASAPTALAAIAPAGRTLNPLSPPSLTHTVCRGTFGNAQFRNWNELVRTAHVQAFTKAGDLDSLFSVTRAQLRAGNHSGVSGFHFVPEIGLSIQGVDANKAWEYSLRLAQYLMVPISVQIEWRRKEGAALPGEIALLEWKP